MVPSANCDNGYMKTSILSDNGLILTLKVALNECVIIFFILLSTTILKNSCVSTRRSE